MKASVVIFPGSNRDRDVCRALRRADCKVERVWHADAALPDGVDVVVLPGGFSYGDYLRCGAIAARTAIMAAVRAHAARGGLVLGVCNGFQILCESGLLPGALTHNAGKRFICSAQHLKIEPIYTPFTQRYAPGQVVKMFIAHKEGNFTGDPETIRRIEGDGCVALRYCDWTGKIDEESNPNGSANNIAGVYSLKRNVLGLMPHPENAIESLTGSSDGLLLFQGLQR